MVCQEKLPTTPGQQILGGLELREVSVQTVGHFCSANRISHFNKSKTKPRTNTANECHPCYQHLLTALLMNQNYHINTGRPWKQHRSRRLINLCSTPNSSLTALWQVQELTQVPIVFKGLYIGQDDDVLEALNHFQHQLQN